MATQNVCSHNKFGYCKHKQMCRNLHINVLCENQECDISTCLSRHPKACRYYRDFGRCKFNPCAFLHIETENTILENLKKESEAIKSKLDDVDKALEILNAKEVELTASIEKCHHNETKLVAMEEKVEKLEAKIVDNENLIQKLLEKFEKVTENVEVEESLFKCDQCDYETKSEKGLNIHKKRKHTIKTICDICDQQFNSVRDMKIHKFTHSYTSKGDIGQTCDKCNYTCDTMESMEVHLGKCKVEEFECGLCETKFKTEEDVDLHLTTCEVYECGECFLRDKILEEMKKHVKFEHETEVFCQCLHHLKMDRDDKQKVNFKRYFLSQL